MTIQPFKAIRPRPDLVDKVASLPYDVVSRKEAIELAKNNPFSYLHIDRSEVDLPDVQDVYKEEVYTKAAENLQTFLQKNWLIKEEEAYFYIYELTFQERTQTGLVATASVADYLNNTIKKHEFTRYDKEEDRTRHMDATDANTSPVFLTYRGKSSINAILHSWKEKHDPVYDFASYYDTQHTVWVISDLEINKQLKHLFAEKVAALYIADGHHRTASAANVAQLRKEAGRISETGHYFLSVLFPIEQLRIFDYNRLIDTKIPDDFFSQLAKDFEIEPLSKAKRRPDSKHIFSLYLDRQWYQLKAKNKIISEELVTSLDASIAQIYIFEKYFGLDDPRQDERLDFVGGIKGLDVLEKAIDRGEARFALALYPTEKEDLLAVADAGKTMPPKSTWFEPKLLSGLFIHDLESASSRK